MRSRLFLTLVLLSAAASAQNRNRHVVVVSLDGFPAVRLHDPSIPLPVLRKLAKEGAIADAMTPVNPTVTWPNHTAMVTGVGPERNGLLYNGMPVRGGEGKPLRVEPWVDKKELVQAPTVYDAARSAGLTTAEVDWVAIYPATSVNFAFPEVPKPDGAIEREMVAAGVISADDLSNWSKHSILQRDELWTRAAVHIIEKHKPNLLLFHLLATDSVQHSYGTNGLAGNAALILADRQLQRVLDALDRAGIRGSTTVIVVSDHGFRSYNKVIHPNALLRAQGLLRDKDGAVDCDAWIISEGGTANVYITRESARAEAMKKMEAAFRTVPGISKVILPSDYAQYGYPNLAKQPRMADMVLAAAPGYSFDAATTGETVTDIPAGALRGAHGYLNSDPDLASILVASGAGIKPGVRLGTVPNVNVAATIARLLGVNLPNIDGKPLLEILR